VFHQSHLHQARLPLSRRGRHVHTAAHVAGPALLSAHTGTTQNQKRMATGLYPHWAVGSGSWDLRLLSGELSGFTGAALYQRQFRTPDHLPVSDTGAVSQLDIPRQANFTAAVTVHS